MFSGGNEDFQHAQSTALGLFTSQSATERNHKAEAVCKSKARNRLKSETTDKVLYVCCNSRLYSRQDKIDPVPQEPHMQWLEAPARANGVAISK
jgi:hypothetical protein